MKKLTLIFALTLVALVGCKNVNQNNTSTRTIFIVNQYNGGKLIYTDTLKPQDRDPFNRVADFYYIKGDTDIQLYQNFVIKSITIK